MKKGNDYPIDDDDSLSLSRYLPTKRSYAPVIALTILIFMRCVPLMAINEDGTCLQCGASHDVLKKHTKANNQAGNNSASNKNNNNNNDDDDDGDYDAIRHNLELIRPRPRNLRLVFVGDSVTRYQYLSLAYFLRYGRWFDYYVTTEDGNPAKNSSATRQHPNHLVNAHSFHHPFHPTEDWNEFLIQSNRMLYPMEACDCLRTTTATSTTEATKGDDFTKTILTTTNQTALERRYFYDAQRNNLLVFILLNGNETTDTITTKTTTSMDLMMKSPSIFFNPNDTIVSSIVHHSNNAERGHYGRLDANSILKRFDDFVGFPFRISNDDKRKNQSSNNTNNATSLVDTKDIAWRYSSWASVITHHVAALMQSSQQATETEAAAETTTHVVLNAGLHPHDFVPHDSRNSSSNNNSNPTMWEPSLAALELKQAMDKFPHWKAVWKTTSLQRNELLHYHDDEDKERHTDDGDDRAMQTTMTDRVMCKLLGGCLNMTWTKQLHPKLYFDNQHFVEPVYRILNEELLQQLGLLPRGYQPLNRSQVLF